MNAFLRKRFRLLLSVGWSSISVLSPVGYGAEDANAQAMAEPACAVPKAASAPAITADPKEAIWQTAGVIPELGVTKNPHIKDGMQTPLPTEVRLLWSPDALYIRFTCVDTALFSPHGTRRDADHYAGDVVEVFLDPMGDARQVIELQVNPAGGVLDILFLATAEPISEPDGRLKDSFIQRDWWSFRNWDIAGLKVATSDQPQPDGSIHWIVDIAIPAESILKRTGKKMFQPGPIRAHFLRYEGPVDPESGERKEELFMTWAPVRHGCPHISPHAMGTLILKE
jgi:hypothetical protein